MKNKHLLLLFFVALCVGLALRQAPWRKSLYPKHNTLRIDTTRCIRMDLRRPGKEDLVFERSDERHWLLTEGDRSIVLQPLEQHLLLQTLAELDIQRLLPTQKPDTLKLDSKQCLELTFFDQNGQTTTYKIGAERWQAGKSVTALMLGRHEGVYWVAGTLRTLLSKDLEAYHLQEPFKMEWADLSKIVVKTRDTILMEALKNDTTADWLLSDTRTVVLTAQIKAWLQNLEGLKHCVFADYFDDTRAKDQLALEITVEKTGEPPLTLRFYRLSSPEIPDDLKRVPPASNIAPPFVFYSSQNPRDYFALDDSMLVQQLMRTPNIAL